MNRTEAARLAAAVNVLRPDWPTASLTTYLAAHIHRPLRDVAVALVWVASDPDTKTPKRMDEAGPWWGAARTSDVPQQANDCRLHRYSGLRHDQATGRSVCGGCWADEHEPDDPGVLHDRGGAPIPADVRALMLEALRPKPTEPADA